MTTPLWTPHSGSESVRSSYSLMSVLSPLSSVRQPPPPGTRDAGRFVSMSDVVLLPSPPQPKSSPLQQQQQQQQHEEREDEEEEDAAAPMDVEAPDPALQPTLECDLPETRRRASPQPRTSPPAAAAAAPAEEDTETRRPAAAALTREQRALLCREEGRGRGATAAAPQPAWLVRVARPLWQPLWAALRWVLAQVIGL